MGDANRDSAVTLSTAALRERGDHMGDLDNLAKHHVADGESEEGDDDSRQEGGAA